MLDLTKVDPRFLALKFSDHQEKAFVYQDLTFKVHTNGNLATIKFVIDLKGDVQIRINPKFTWGLIQTTVARYYDWCLQEQVRRYSQFDLTSVKAQRTRTLVNQDLVYLWGLPYFIHLNPYSGQEERVAIRSRPSQVTPVLVPKGRSRYSAKFYYLLHHGYLHRAALDNLPVLNQEQWLLPRKCLWGNPHDFIRYPLLSQALLDPKLSAIYDRTRPLGNFLLEQVGSTLQLITRHAQAHFFYGSRFLSQPQRLLVEALIAPLAGKNNPDFMVRRHHERMVAKCETLTSDYWKAIVTGNITSKESSAHFPVNPFFSYDLSTINAQDPAFTPSLSLRIADHLKDQRLVRNLPPVEVLWRGLGSSEERRAQVRAAQEHGAYVTFYPESSNYHNLTLESLSAEYQRQIKFYHSGCLDLAPAQRQRQEQGLAAAARAYSLLPGPQEPAEPPHFDPSLLLTQPQLAFGAPATTPQALSLGAPATTSQTLGLGAPATTPQALGQSAPANLPLSELELTLCDAHGHEIDPALALMALLPDNPEQANYLEQMPPQLALNELKTSYVRMVATDLLAQHVAKGNFSYAHETLVTPGCLEVYLKGKVTEDKVRRALQQFLAQEVSVKATHFLECVHAYYDEIYLAAAQHLKLPTLRWYQRPVRSKAMSPLGLCKADGGLAEIRLNQMLAHYPYNVMTSVASHELCHLGCFNHGPAFYTLLSALNPDANTISDALSGLGILPL